MDSLITVSPQRTLEYVIFEEEHYEMKCVYLSMNKLER